MWEITAPSGLPVTYYSIRRLRHLLPRCEIIVSTWSDDNCHLLEADKVVFSKDPGPQKSTVTNGTANNVNRQIVSTVSGLKVASNDLVLKLRSDVVLTGVGFLKLFRDCLPPAYGMSLFERKIIANNLSSRNPRMMPEFPLPFHPSDHAHFGLKADLLTLWDVALQSEEDATYFSRHERPNRFRDSESSKLAPEQYICLGAFKKKFDVDMQHYSDVSALERSEKLLLENFCFMRDRDFSIHLAKYHTRYHAQFEWMRYPANRSGRWRQRYRFVDRINIFSESRID